MQKCCANCDAFMLTSKEQGICRAHAPRVFFAGMRPIPLNPSVAEPMMLSAWPTVGPGNFCREHRVREPSSGLKTIDMSGLANLSMDGNA